MIRDKRGEFWEGAVMAGVAFIVIISFVLVMASRHTIQSEAKFEVWDAQAPFGHYWVQTSGEGGGLLFWHFEMWSDLRESYTIKYEEGGELKTVIFASVETTITQEIHGDAVQTRTVPHIILVDENISPEFRVVSTVKFDCFGAMYHGIPVQIDYYLTLPDPKLFPEEG